MVDVERVEPELEPEHVESRRLQSPSSILTFKQCPRKYFYRYILRLPSKKSIHLVRGSIVHKVLERFYDLDLARVQDASFPTTTKVILHELFRTEWQNAHHELNALGLAQADLKMYEDETKTMMNNFFHYLMDRLAQYPNLRPVEALDRFKPKREIELHSKTHHVRGYADAIHEHDGKTYILDYKTSKSLEITPEYELQLSIYGMIFEELNHLPDEVGIFFLKHGQELRLPVTREMVERAKREVRDVHEKTQSKNIDLYPMLPGPLCKYNGGECDYYGLCFGNKKITDFTPELVHVGRR